MPHTRKEEKSKEKGFSFSTISTFEGALSRPSSADLQPPYSLPPNIYKIKSSIEELLSKRISKRGPYDLFTGESIKKINLRI